MRPSGTQAGVADVVPRLHILRRGLAGLPPQESMNKLLDLLSRWKSNEEIFNLLRVNE